MSNEANKEIESIMSRYNAIQQVCILELIKAISSCTDDELDRICDQFGIGGCHGTV